jgi:ATP-binding cassette, subfamily B, bacterial PglK
MISKIWIYLSKRRKIQFGLILILMIMASLAEMISIGAVIPFISVLASPELVFNHQIAQPFIRDFELTEPNQLILPLTVAFIFAAILASMVRLLLLYGITRLSFAAGHDISVNIYHRTLYQSYSVHINKNSSEVINAIILKSNTVISGVLIPLLMLISSLLLLIGIMTALFVINTQVALIAIVSFATLYFLVVYLTRNQLNENSQRIADQSTQMIKSLQEGLGGIRDVIIDGIQEFYTKLYREADYSLRRASGTNSFIANSPRFVMEAMGMILIAGLALFLTKHDGSMRSALPVLGALALGAQRMLPALQQAYSSYSVMKGSRASYRDVIEMLEQPIPSNVDQEILTKLSFNKEIKLENVAFKYNDNLPWVFKGLSLKLKKGDRIGFMGATGAGKSTLLDIIMGLLSQNEGEFFVDNHRINNENRRAWQLNIAHVPQNIFLSDTTLEENIAFGIPKELINRQQIEKVSKQAQIEEFVHELKDGYQTIIGEGGVKLSGGQRQRIGIARALYKNANVLIFDEATSALDYDTEVAVMNSINKLGRNLTIFIIAHRLTTLKDCDQIINLSKNDVQITNYEDIIKSS